MTATGLLRPVAAESVLGAIGWHAGIGTGRLVRMVPHVGSFPAPTLPIGPEIRAWPVGPVILLTGAVAAVIAGRFRPLVRAVVSLLTTGPVLVRFGVAGRGRVTVS